MAADDPDIGCVDSASVAGAKKNKNVQNKDSNSEEEQKSEARSYCEKLQIAKPPMIKCHESLAQVWLPPSLPSPQKTEIASDGWSAHREMIGHRPSREKVNEPGIGWSRAGLPQTRLARGTAATARSLACRQSVVGRAHFNCSPSS